MYCEALALCDSVDVEEKKNMSTIERIRIRTQKLERAALAASAFAGIQHSRVGLNLELLLISNH